MATATRRVSLNEVDSEVLEGVGPRRRASWARCMSTTEWPTGDARSMWDDPITENPALGATEVWEIYNFTVDAHPIHIHLVQFEVVGRRALHGGSRGTPEPWEPGSRTPSSPTRARSPG